MTNLVQQQYDRIAAIYDQRWQFYISNTLSFLVSWAHIHPTEQVLDVACGTGEFASRLTAQHPHQRIVGVDFSAAMLAIAHHKCAGRLHVSFQTAIAEALPWQTPRFDVVVCANAFHYFDAPVAALGQMQQVLKSPGRLIILDWCRDFLVCRICDWVLDRFDPAYQRCYSEAELHHLLATAGFSVRRSQRRRFGLVWGLMAVEAVPHETS